MLETAHTVYWAALWSNVLATLLFALALSFQWRMVQLAGVATIFGGLVILTASLAMRWIATGHGPYLGAYEALGSYAWAVMLLYSVVQARLPATRPAGVAVAGAALLLLGAGVLNSAAVQFESPAMRSEWLWIHVTMAKMAGASFILAAGVSLVTLKLKRAPVAQARADGPAAHSEQAKGALESLSVGLASFGFLVLAVVIGAGALWANAAWGAYWNWDPIETWSLATWVLYGGVLHLRRLWGFSGNRWAWANIAALLFSVTLLLVTRVITLSPHWLYLG